MKRRALLGLFLGFISIGAQAASPISQFDMEDYQASAAPKDWAQPPSNHHRLYLDVYNVTDFFDAETGNQVGFADHTILADTIRPTATLLWDDRFRIQLGAIAEKLYGDSPSFISVDPWIQLLWKPIQALDVVFGDLSTPHYYQPALFYPNNYFEQNHAPQQPKIPQLASVPSNYFTQFTHETGAQVILKKENLYDDLFFNYEQQDTAEHNEKFVLGFVHRNTFWNWLSLNYQSHWIHYGGQNNFHPIATRNDVAQIIGPEVEYRPDRLNYLTVGGAFYYLHSHLRQDSTDPTLIINSTNGDGRLLQGYIRWGRVKAIYGDFRGHNYYHEDGDPMYILPILRMATVRWDILYSPDFNLYMDTTGYFIGTNDLGYGKYVKTAFHVQGSWQFSIPIVEWTNPAPSPKGPPVPTRWDYGI